MGNSIMTISDVEYHAFKAGDKKLSYKIRNTAFIKRRFMWFIEEYWWNGTESTLSQLGTQLKVPITWLGEMPCFDDLDEKADYQPHWRKIAPHLDYLNQLKKGVTEKIDQLDLKVTNSRISRSHPDYIPSGELAADFDHIISNLNRYKKFGGQSFIIFWI